MTALVTLTVPPDVRGAAPPPAADAELAVGSRVGRYVIVAPLGRGGMSTVYRAEDPALQRQVALKVLRPELALHDAACARFAREGQAMAQVVHPNVASVHDVGVDGGRPFLALELLEGGTLGGWLATPRSRADVDRVLAGAARGLAAAHARGIVHRDFKPDNVLLTREGVPRVSDFGLAGSLARPLDAHHALGSPALTADGAIVGTPAYMAPEQRDGRPADERADQYSLCLVWLEALGRDRAAADGDPGGARASRGHLRLLLRGLERDPARRWPSVAALLAAHDRRRARRRAATVVVAALAVTAAVVAVWPARRSLAAPSVPALGVARVLDRHAVGDGSWRFLLGGDGHTAVRSSPSLDALTLEDLDGGAAESLPLPPGLHVAKRADALAAMSADGSVVLVRMEDGSVWRTGRGRRAAVLIRAAAGGALCLHPAGDRVAVARTHEPIELRATDDGRLLASAGPASAAYGHLCTWLGDRLVLGWRAPGKLLGEVRVLDERGEVGAPVGFAGELSSLASDGERVLVAHQLDPMGERIGVIDAFDPRRAAPPRELVRTPSAGYPQLAPTARGLFVTFDPVAERAVYGALPAVEGAPLAWQPLPIAGATSGTIAWADAEHLIVRQHDRALRVGVVDETVVPVAGGADAPAEPCDRRGRCAVTRIDGDDVTFAPRDPATGTIGPVLVRHPRGRSPEVAVAGDGRWVVVAGGELALIDPATGRRQPLPLPGWSIDAIAWGHDDRYLVATSRSGATFSVLRIELDGRATVLARSPGAAFMSPRVSPDGRWLAARIADRLFEYRLLAPVTPGV